MGFECNPKDLNCACCPKVEKLESQLSVARDLFCEIKRWSPCYCLSDEETGLPGGKTCPTCIAKEALSKIKQLEGEG